MRVHFIGIGGSGMMPLAVLASLYNYDVSGSDRNLSEPKARELAKFGIKVYNKASEENLPDSGYAVYSTAIRDDHPEKAAAYDRKKKPDLILLHRMEFLNILTEKFPVRFAVAGTHGKTSTSSMTGWLLQQCGYDPLIAVGGSPLYLKHSGGVRKGAGQAAVFETDESDGSFLKSHANYRIVLNADADHLDYYGNFNKLKDAFAEFAENGKVTVLNGDDPSLYEIYINYLNKRSAEGISGNSAKPYFIVYGTGKKIEELKESKMNPPAYAESVSFTDNSDSLMIQGSELSLKIPGRHFTHNAAAAVLIVREAVLNGDLPLPHNYQGARDDIASLTAHLSRIMKEFPGVERRIEKIAEINGVGVYDDYGHHPAEITAVIRALKARLKNDGRLFVVFQPHRYTRTRDLAREFAWALEEAHHVYLLPLYAAGEAPITGVSEKSIAGAFTLNGKCTLVSDDSPQSLAELISHAASGDIFVYQGAGDISAKIRRGLESLYPGRVTSFGNKLMTDTVPGSS